MARLSGYLSPRRRWVGEERLLVEYEILDEPFTLLAGNSRRRSARYKAPCVNSPDYAVMRERKALHIPEEEQAQ